MPGGHRGERPGLLNRRRVALTITGATLVTVALGFELAGQRGRFSQALQSAPILTLLLITALQIVALLARSEAWHVCVEAAGGTVPRRRLFRGAGLGYVAIVHSGSVGLATRIACLRTAAPSEAPPVPASAAEVPMIAVEVGLAAVFSGCRSSLSQ